MSINQTVYETMSLDLQYWSRQKAWGGKEKLAREQILNAFSNGETTVNLKSFCLWTLPWGIEHFKNLEHLILTDNKLSELSAEIGKCQNLKTIALDNNRFKSFPKEIEKLKNLETLVLKDNELSCVPKDLRWPICLKEIDLSHNKLDSFPEGIITLESLQKLNLGHNCITSVPQGIEKLKSLTDLILRKNGLKSLPNTLGALLNLKELKVDKNPDLQELPRSLSQIPGLTFIYTNGTKIEEKKRDQILKVCEDLRSTQDALPARLRLWGSLTQNCSFNLDQLMKGCSQLKREEKTTINEWLCRLERTDDYNYKPCQEKIADVVFGMLQSILDDENFREQFLSQAGAYNSDCDNKAAMGLNMLFIAWHLHKLPEKATFKEKVTLLERAAKTLALRRIIGEKIENYENKNGLIFKEEVEIYLYYEIVFSKIGGPKPILTIIDGMPDDMLGRPEMWINEEEIAKEVDDSYLKDLLDLPLFDKVIGKEKSFQELWAKPDEETRAKMEELLEKEPNNKSKIESLEGVRKQKKLDVLISWMTSPTNPIVQQSRPEKEVELFESEILDWIKGQNGEFDAVEEAAQRMLKAFQDKSTATLDLKNLASKLTTFPSTIIERLKGITILINPEDLEVLLKKRH